MSIYISGGTLIDCTGAAPRANTGILIEGDRIAAIDCAEAPAGATVIDATGLTIMPGLINMHDHLAMRDLIGFPLGATSGKQTRFVVNSVRNAQTALQRGWTTVRDMTGPGTLPLEMRELIKAGELPGPRVISCGAAISVTGGHAHVFCVEADGVDGVRKAAREQLKLGADFIKVMASHDPVFVGTDQCTQPEMREEEIRAAFEEAQVRGKKTACHVMGTIAIDRVLNAGVNVISHGYYLNKEQAQRMAEECVFLDPTLSSYGIHTLSPKLNRGQKWVDEHKVLLEPMESAFRNAVEAGVRIVEGTDTAGQYLDDLRMMREFGLDSMETLRACTANAADALGLGHQIGTIETGKFADIVLVEGDPLAEVDALGRVSWVIQMGKAMRPAEITQRSPV